MNKIMENGTPITYQELNTIAVPETTETYQPLPYRDFADKLLIAGENHLQGFTFENADYGVARDGQHLFAIHNYKNGESGMRLSVGARNSYNKTLSASVAIGANVVVCTNLMITGGIHVMRKHTKNIMRDFDGLLDKAMADSSDNYYAAIAARETYSDINLDNNRAYEILGRLYGKKIIGARQMTKALKEYHSPSHKEHGKGTAWTLYNACTEALKTTRLGRYMSNHQLLHQEIEDCIKDDGLYISDKFIMDAEIADA
ncbi:MAG: hypothetical protein Unbinned2514contig1001_3 [Prokaryotic dsDNA virus sp.]|nr:MAG: hypothetical protein Unbinned2514contig1001_3 [Prokaryotic dsDNA virus sp.]|tara:strand:- start:14505 stop:15278 length:774 start_codon:yes stop_codon:yes gene_type:complete